MNSPELYLLLAVSMMILICCRVKINEQCGVLFAAMQVPLYLIETGILIQFAMAKFND
jgi:hypothetical protein